jgi:hypothetical protein
MTGNKECGIAYVTFILRTGAAGLSSGVEYLDDQGSQIRLRL